MDSLNQIKADIVKDNVCPNLAQTATQIVMGDGPLDADIVFVGEAPGKNEDIQGKPFVGQAGKNLQKNLEAIGLNREDVYITNIVKYRPPGNRDPLPNEKEAFMPYLLRELNLVKPKIIAPLGRHAMNQFLPEAKITQAHGRVHHWRDYKLFPLYHPAALIYNRTLIQVNENDFQALNKLINGN